MSNINQLIQPCQVKQNFTTHRCRSGNDWISVRHERKEYFLRLRTLLNAFEREEQRRKMEDGPVHSPPLSKTSVG